MFSLYSLTFLPQQLDSALELEFSSLRKQTAHIANITASPAEFTYEGLERAVSNLSRMYSDTMSLSYIAGSPEPCLLPIMASISDFPVRDEESSLSSFQSSLVSSFQSSLINTSVDRALSPPHIPSNSIPIIPRPLLPPTSSTPTSFLLRNDEDGHNYQTDTMPVPMLISTLGNFGSGTLEELSTVEILSTPTVLLSQMDDEMMMRETLEAPPAVTNEDLVFVARANDPSQLLSRSLPATMLTVMDVSMPEPQAELLLQGEAVLSAPTTTEPDDEEPVYITYEKFAEMYSCYGPY